MDTVCIFVAFPSTIQTNHFYAKEQRRNENGLLFLRRTDVIIIIGCEYVTPVLA
jgi:hypothetical protein